MTSARHRRSFLVALLAFDLLVVLVCGSAALDDHGASDRVRIIDAALAATGLVLAALTARRLWRLLRRRRP